MGSSDFAIVQVSGRELYVLHKVMWSKSKTKLNPCQIQTKILNSQAFRWWLPGWTQRTPDVTQPSYPTNVKKLCVAKGYRHALAVFSLTQKKYLWSETPLTTQKNSILSKSTFCSMKSTFFWVFSGFLGVKGCVDMGSSVVNPYIIIIITHIKSF